MHIVTFYSFKGGVGRTMGLVNTAAILAHRDQKVLLVDFDLEAPGLSTYAPFTRVSKSRGIVEYVSEYIRTAAAPDAKDFTTECELGHKKIWVMPAGTRDAGYSARLNAIDWQTLYSAQNGYLMFEDLKQQWEHQGFDYVLIDSRTGLTDVGGICTRQLPHAVVLMFFPNDQNILGLEGVSEEIRQEPLGSREEVIITHYCVSNVPDIDDEEHILERKLDQARERLKYEGEPSVIHHYNSLSLIEQSIFVIDRPESKLAKEYQKLATQVSASNLEDLRGALARLKTVREALRENPDHGTSPAVVQLLSKIDMLHPTSSEVQLILASIYFQLGEIAPEYACLTRAINNGASSPMARRRRAQIASLQGRRDDAISDLRIITNDPRTISREFVAAVDLLRELDSNWSKDIYIQLANRQLDLSEATRLGRILMTDRTTVPLAISMLKQTLALPVSAHETKDPAATTLVLALIHEQEYEVAMRLIAPTRNDVFRAGQLAMLFNYAMAEWGHTGVPPRDLMQKVTQFKNYERYSDVNRHQCYALAFYVCGDHQKAQAELDRAKEELADVGGRVFSCWRYMQLGREEMAADLRAMEDMVTNGTPAEPEVFRKRALNHLNS